MCSATFINVLANARSALKGILFNLHFKMHPIEVVQKTSKNTTFLSTSIGQVLELIIKTIFKFVTSSFSPLITISKMHEIHHLSKYYHSMFTPFNLSNADLYINNSAKQNY
jgi:hypothetical protein